MKTSTRQSDYGITLLGGLVATLAMSVFLYLVLPTLLNNPLDIAAMLDTALGLGWGVGVAIHMILGAVVFPLVFVKLLFGRLPGRAWRQGMLWGALLWVVAEIVVIPITGGGMFHSNAGGVRAALAFLIAHLVYGAIFGSIVRSSLPDEDEIAALDPHPHAR